MRMGLLSRSRIFHLLVSLIICLGIFRVQSGYADHSENIAGAIVSVKEVATITTGPHGKPHSARPGEAVHTADVIRTSQGGAVKILLKDHSVVDLGGGTVFKVDQYKANQGADREIETSMTQGMFRGSVTEKIQGAGKFHLKTPTATMGVRGTEFVVDAPLPSRPGAEPAATKITVLQGQVEVTPIAPKAPTSTAAVAGGSHSAAAAAPKPVVLGAGQQVVAESGTSAPLRPVTLDAGTLNKVASASKVADNTFVRSVAIDNNASGGNASQSSPQSGSSGSSSGGSSPARNISSAAASAAPPPPPPGASTTASAGSSTPPAPPVPPAAPASGILSNLNDVTAAVTAPPPAAAPPPPPPPVVTSVGIGGTFAPGSPPPVLQTPANANSKITVIIQH